MDESVTVGLKRIYDAIDSADGARVLVDRIWPRGVSRDRATLHSWLKEVAPSTELRKWYGHEPERWPEFRNRYREELETNAALPELVALANAQDVTLVYSARDVERNQAVVLAEVVAERLEPSW